MSLRVWLPLNGTLDNQGLDNITCTLSGGIAIDNNGKIGKCYNFDGTNGQLLLTNLDLRGLPQVSFAFWCCPVEDLGGLFQISVGGTHRFQISSSNLTFRDSNNSTLRSISYNTTFVSGEWVHIACIYNRGQITIYVNGVQTNRNSTYFHEDSVLYSDLNQYRIGRIRVSTGDLHYEGKMNDFRIYDHSLSPMEVKQISQGLILHYPLNNNGWGQENLLINSNIEKTSKNSYPFWPFASEDIPKISGNVCTISFDAKSTVDNVACDVYFRSTTMVGQSIIVSNITTEYKRYNVTMTAPTSAFVSICIRNNYNVPGASTTATYSYKNIKVELGQKATPWCPHEADELYDKLGLNDNVEYDTSGFCNNGTRTGTFSWISDTPKYNVGTKFLANIIKNTIFNFTSNIWTVAFWYYYDTAPSAYQGFLCLSRNAGGDADKKLAAMPKSSYIWFKFENTNLTVSSLKTKVWTHIVMTFDGTNGRVYENGVLKGTTGAVSSIYTDCDDFVIGARANAANATTTACQLVGNMSDVRIYVTALSTDDIKALYQNSAYIDNQGNIYGAIYEEV